MGGAEIFQLTAARRRLALPNRYHKQSASISTHSRAKAAGQFTITGLCCLPDFNSQPREGGWLVRPCMRLRLRISTHSRAKAAGFRIIIFVRPFQFQLTAARRRLGRADGASLHAPPYFNSQPREGGWLHLMAVCWRKQRFQLTAARRRLAPRPTPAPPHHDFNSQPREGGWLAAMSFFSCPPPHFNSQPREGGWRGKNPAHQPAEYFNSQPREGGW